MIIYYQDQRGTDRKLVGKIVEIDGDRLWLENVHKRTGELWRGAINCNVCKIGIISTIQGWSGREDDMKKKPPKLHEQHEEKAAKTT